MKRRLGLWIVLFASSASGALASGPPIALHPENPHYFLFRGKPAFLIGSGEHYGAVLNPDFDFLPYLDELRARGLNLTRLFSGVYSEVPGSFNIRNNTLAPAPDRLLTPWARSKSPGAKGYGMKFDLDAWDDAYFRRLRRFVAEAGKRGVVVEFVLFCPFYDDGMWNVSAQHARNNVNGVGDVPRTEVYTLKHPEIVARHEALVRKVVGELKEFDNLYYEICNEPYFGGVTLDWQRRIATVIREEETSSHTKHLIAQNIANGAARVEKPFPEVSILNFHYAIPPDAVGMNYGLKRAIGDDETGFKGTGDRHYRTEAWLFLLAGGSAFSNLDYSFTADHEDGTGHVADPTPGGGGPRLRKQFAILKSFLEGFDYLKMAPDLKLLKSGAPPGTMTRALSRPGREYALYLSGGGKADLTLDLPRGRCRAEWVDPLTGAVLKRAEIDHQGGDLKLSSPAYAEDMALRMTIED